MVPFLDQQVQVVLEDAPDRDMLEILNKGAVTPNTLGIVFVGLDHHLSICLLPQAVPTDEQVVLETLPPHEKISLTPTVLYADLIVTFELQSVIAVHIVVGVLYRVGVGDLPFVHQLAVRSLQGWEQTSYF